MARVCGACCGLLVFSAIILCGLLAGNSAEHIMLRAVFGLLAGYLLGSLSGWIGTCIVRDDAARTPAGTAVEPPAATEQTEAAAPTNSA